jgi:hypothetical protein
MGTVVMSRPDAARATGPGEREDSPAPELWPIVCTLGSIARRLEREAHKRTTSDGDVVSAPRTNVADHLPGAEPTDARGHVPELPLALIAEAGPCET